jgi:iron complex transport system substrate-binding protein
MSVERKCAKLKKITLTILSVFLALTLAGCGSDTGNSSVKSTSEETGQVTTPSSDVQPYLTFTDDAGQKVVLAKKPERIVVLATEALNLFYQLGGNVVGYATAPGTPVRSCHWTMVL